MQFFLAAAPADFTAMGTDEPTERKKVEEWQKAHPTAADRRLQAADAGQGGPPPDLRWYPMRAKSDELQDTNQERRLHSLDHPAPDDAGAGQGRVDLHRQ